MLVSGGNRMTNSQTIIEQLDNLTSFLASLRTIEGTVWSDQIAKGKWSIHDIIAHIMGWDKNILDKIIPKLLRQELVILEEDTDVQGFNNRAVEYGRTLNQEKLLNEAIFYRSQMVNQLKKLPEDAFLTTIPATNSLTLISFLQNMFVAHDTHHKLQIEKYLSQREKAGDQVWGANVV
jgi:uncharacterized damage-inducible protein DinB